MISLDTETTGKDLRHAARPFFVTISNEDHEVYFWEWDVEPISRLPVIPDGDLDQIATFIAKRGTQGQAGKQDDTLALQNPKFDVAALNSIKPGLGLAWPWNRTHDTLTGGHVLASNQPHDLTSMTLHYLGIDILPYEERLKAACVEARRLARSRFPDWTIAKAGLPGMPSAKGGGSDNSRGGELDKLWKYDAWLPRRLAQELNYPDDHPWWTVTREYGNTDSAVTLPLWKVIRAELERRGLWEIYLTKLRVTRILYLMESHGVSLSQAALEAQRAEYKDEAERAARICVNIAGGFTHEVDGAEVPFTLELPKSGMNNSLRQLLFDQFEDGERVSQALLPLPVLKRSDKTGEASMDKAVMAEYLKILPPTSKQHAFVRNLAIKRKRDTALAYMESYERFWLPIPGYPGWFMLHPSLNANGSDTLRFTSANPNEQNISKQEGFNLRQSFGPCPGREWYSIDASNIELRLPAYECGQEEFIELFERPNDPPYFGSNHLLVAHLLFPKEFEQCVREGVSFKDRYKSTLYQRVKNGNFAVQYGAVDRADGMGTADRTYGIPGAQARIKTRFSKQEALNQKWIDFANKHGYVETMPDKTVCAARGYPLMCTRSEWGKILPTVPLNYHIQGTAMWWMIKAMIRCQAQLDEWNLDGLDAHIVMQVHDELVFDFPKSAMDPAKYKRGDQSPGNQMIYHRSNLWRIDRIKKLMVQGGDDIGVPTPVSCEYHAKNWAEGIKV